MLIYSQQTFLLLSNGILDNNKMISCDSNNNKQDTRSMFVLILDLRGVS